MAEGKVEKRHVNIAVRVLPQPNTEPVEVVLEFFPHSFVLEEAVGVALSESSARQLAALIVQNLDNSRGLRVTVDEKDDPVPRRLRRKRPPRRQAGTPVRSRA